MTGQSDLILPLAISVSDRRAVFVREDLYDTGKAGRMIYIDRCNLTRCYIGGHHASKQQACVKMFGGIPRLTGYL